jgi:tRNA nucleotidyltransferase (CCA-adding enzyme)
MDDKVEIIGRSRRPEIDVRWLAEEFGGGGHAVAAAASVKGQTLVEVKDRLARLLTERYHPTLSAQDVMTTPAKTIADDVTIVEAEAVMTKYGVNVLPVLDPKQQYCGVVTRETIQKALFHQLGERRIVEILQTEGFTAASETPFREVEARMIEHNQRFVAVLKSRRVVGVITRTDLLRTLHDDVLQAARARVKGDEPVSPPHSRNIRSLLKERLPQRFYALLEEAGQLADRMGVSVFAVGGFVRDLLLDIKNLDLDLVVEGDGIGFARALARQMGGRAKAHDRFGTAVVLLVDGVKLDVATARTEYYEYPTALPTVERSSIKKDLYRRDFTINTLAVRLNSGRFGELIDFYGGRRDLKDKTIRVLHSLSFVEDPTRVFRAIRFEQRFAFRLGKETVMLIKGAAKMDLFHRLSGHRLLDELMLLFSEEEPRKAIARLADLDLLRFIHPKLAWSPRLQALLKGAEDALDWYKIASLNWQDQPNTLHVDAWVVYFMALMEGLPDQGVSETLKRLAAPQRHAEKILTGRRATSGVLRRLAKRPPPRPSETYHLLTGLSAEALLLMLAQTKSESVKRQVSGYLTTYQHVKPFLTGAALKALGLRPGPIYKKILTRLLDARLNGEVRTEADEQRLLKSLAGE